MATTDDLEIVWSKPRSFLGSNHPGIRLNNLTTTQRDALTGSGAPKAGHAIFNTTTGQIEIYDGTNWVSHFAVDNISVAGEITVDGDTGTGAATAGVINLNTSETTVVADDHIGRIEFAAPSEGSGTDAVAMAAYIAAVAGAEFTASVNDTDLVFGMGVSEAATEKFRMTSDLLLKFGGVTSSFPSWKRSSTALEARLADDSASTRIVCSDIVYGSNAAVITTLGSGIFSLQLNNGAPATSLMFGAAGAAAGQNILVVRKTGIADATATGIITVTVPNANHNAAIFLDILAHLGTGTDASESSRCATGCIVLARTSGADTVATAAALTTAQIATVSGGGTLTLAYDVSTLTGASNAQQTFTIRLTITVSGTITDHTAVVSARLLNSLASGVTIAAA